MVCIRQGLLGRTIHVCCASLLLAACGGGGSSGNTATAMSPVSGMAMAMQVGSTALLTWTPPTENTDQSVLVDLAGYRVIYGSSSTNLDRSIELKNAGLTSYMVENLPPGTWYFAILAVNSRGNASAPSQIASKTF